LWIPITHLSILFHLTLNKPLIYRHAWRRDQYYRAFTYKLQWKFGCHGKVQLSSPLRNPFKSFKETTRWSVMLKFACFIIILWRYKHPFAAWLWTRFAVNALPEKSLILRFHHWFWPIKFYFSWFFIYFFVKTHYASLPVQSLCVRSFSGEADCRKMVEGKHRRSCLLEEGQNLHHNWWNKKPTTIKRPVLEKSEH